MESLRKRGILTSSTLANALLRTPRHAFVDSFYEYDAHGRAELVNRTAIGSLQQWYRRVYADQALVVSLDHNGKPACSSTAPWLMVAMLEAVQLEEGQRVLEIGTGTGFNAALIAAILAPTGFLLTVEIREEWATRARRHLLAMGVTGPEVRTGDGLQGVEHRAPFDRIIVTAGCRQIASSWIARLIPGGLLVLPFGGEITGGLLLMRKTSEGTAVGRFLDLPGVAFTPLQGQQPTLPRKLRPDWQGPGAALAGKPRVVIGAEPSGLFDPTALDSAQSGFRFLLQFEMPTAELVYVGPERYPVLIDQVAGHALAVVRSAGQAGSTFDVWGDSALWRHLCGAYQEWIRLGRPTARDYAVDVDRLGRQRTTVTSEFGSLSWSPGA